MIKVIPQSVTKLKGFETPLKKLEHCCRIAYRSHKKTSQGSDKKLFKLVFTNKHYSVLEHYWIYLDLNKLYHRLDLAPEAYFDCNEIFELLMYDPHLKKYAQIGPVAGTFQLNLRTLIEAHFLAQERNWIIKRILLRVLGEETYFVVTGDYLFTDILPENCMMESGDVHTFEIVTNRAVANEIVRHRQLSYTQESTRYVDKAKEVEFIKPFGLYREDLAAWEHLCNSSVNTYKVLRDSGTKVEIARGVLPLDLATTIVCTGTTEMWKHFVSLRDSKQAHPQIKWIAEKIKNSLE